MQKKMLILAALLPQLALAQNPANSKISNVLVYPGGAHVERVARVAAGARELKLNCLSARFDVDSLKVQADAGIQVGDVSVQTVDRARAPECANTGLDLRIRELQEQKASISAEGEAQELVIGYLKSFGNEKSGSNTALVTTAEQLRRTGQDALQRRLSAQKRLNDLDLQLTPLLAEQRRQFQANPQVRSVQIRLAAQNEGEVKLSYRLSQAGWTPVYRAYLDTVKSQVRLERHAQVAQNSGEDWNGINLKLSTSQPDQASQLYPPSPWTLSIIPPLPKETHRVQPMMMAPPAPAVMAVAAPGDYRGAEMPSFDVSVFQSEYAAEFQVPGKISLNSDGQKTGFVLGSQIIDAQVLVRVQPKQEAQAYLLANAARPAGSWPSGNLQLYRDNDFIGQSQLAFGSQEKLELLFGRDNMVRVEVEPELRDDANKGFINSRIEKKYTNAYVIENNHKTAVTLQVLEASPVARHEDIKVETKFTPEATQSIWNKQPGIIAWQLPLEAGKKLKLRADYTISYPKDAMVNGLR
ncbi:DUF4139 domain-containing protein [Undibacterium sp. TC4M20W]|uniref:DUF4139 domain-containing protein n=1 Tax=Undibacterium sp. TC4M20W TaxID=3413052 RepID=UPI003BF3DED3